MARSISAGSAGRAVSVSGRRLPNSRWKAPSGITANSSCDCPNSEPLARLTPTTRKCTPWIVIVRSSGSAPPNSRSAVDQPRIVTFRRRTTSVGVHEASALRGERRKTVVLARDALNGDPLEHLVAVAHLAGLPALRHHGRDRAG